MVNIPCIILITINKSSILLKYLLYSKPRALLLIKNSIKINKRKIPLRVILIGNKIIEKAKISPKFLIIFFKKNIPKLNIKLNLLLKLLYFQLINYICNKSLLINYLIKQKTRSII